MAADCPTSSLFFLAAACALIASACATEHVVGGSTGWATPASTDFYQKWAQDRKFVVGDKLVFNYSPSADNVLEVNEREFDACTQFDVIGMYYRGSTVLDLDKPGPRYFYSGIGIHCELGQKLAIDVVEP